MTGKPGVIRSFPRWFPESISRAWWRSRPPRISIPAMKWWSPAAEPPRYFGEAKCRARAARPGFHRAGSEGHDAEAGDGHRGTAGFTAMQSIMELERRTVCKPTRSAPRR